MSRQVQDAYIVAAARTPIGKAPRGALRTVRPDDLLVTAIRGALLALWDGNAFVARHPTTGRASTTTSLLNLMPIVAADGLPVPLKLIGPETPS